MNASESTSANPTQKVRHYDPQWEQEKVVRIPVKWLWHYSVLHSLRERLVQEQESEMTTASQQVEPHSMSMADSATDEFDHEMALWLLSRERDILSEVDAAIHRILTGTYGICEDSGEPIPAGRLKIIPWTRYTKEAQEKREREGLDSPGGIAPLRSIQEPGAAILAEAENPESEELLVMESSRHRRETEIRELEQGSDAEIGLQASIKPPALSKPSLPQRKKSAKGSSNRKHNNATL